MARKRGSRKSKGVPVEEDTKEFSSKPFEIINPIKPGAQVVSVKKEDDMSLEEFSRRREVAVRNAAAVGKKGTILRVGSDGSKMVVVDKQVSKPCESELHINPVEAVFMKPKKLGKAYMGLSTRDPLVFDKSKPLSPEEVEKIRKHIGFVAEGDV
jgi:hypothetical protein